MTDADKPKTDPLLPRDVLAKLRDAILAGETAMTEIQPGVRELAVGMFVIHSRLHASGSGGRSSNLTISMRSPGSCGGYSGSTLASFRSGQLVLFRNGPWVNELLGLLTKSGRQLTGAR